MLSQPTVGAVALSGSWTALGLGAIAAELDAYAPPPRTKVDADGSRIVALDSAGAWVLQRWMGRMRSDGQVVALRGIEPHFGPLLELVAQQVAASAARTPAPDPPLLPPLARLGRGAADVAAQGGAQLEFLGRCALGLAGWLVHPSRIRVRPVLYNIRSAGFDALPIVGLLSFLLGIVIAHESAAQLAQYGANIYVADLVGLAMLREFAPLITAIVVAGRSGSAYAAQIGTMAVSEEIDALQMLGIAPVDVLVLPKIIALAVALPLLTVFADVLGVLGGMIIAQAQLGVGFGEFLDRAVKAVSLSSYLVGVGKATMFAAIVALVGCYQGFGTRGGAESVGRQTTRSVVQSIFLVIVVDAMFSMLFSALDF